MRAYACIGFFFLLSFAIRTFRAPNFVLAAFRFVECRILFSVSSSDGVISNTLRQLKM